MTRQEQVSLINSFIAKPVFYDGGWQEKVPCVSYFDLSGIDQRHTVEELAERIKSHQLAWG